MPIPTPPEPMGNEPSSTNLAPYVLLCAAAALAIDFGTIHRQQQGDSLIPVLTSLYCWTPFFWEENRFGMLVPLLATPIKHPLANMLFQDWVLIFAGLSVFYLLPRYVYRGSMWPSIGTLSAASFLFLAPERYRFSFFIDQCYGLSLALGLAAVLLCEAGPHRSRRTIVASVLAAVALSVLAHWVNVGAVLILGPLVVLRFLFHHMPLRFLAKDLLTFGHPARADAWEFARLLLVISVGFSTGFAGMRASTFHETSTSLAGLPVSSWPDAWSRFAANVWEGQTPELWPVILMGAAQLGLAFAVFHPSLDQQVGALWRGGTVLVVAGLFYGLFAGTREWVERSGFADRYAIPAVVLLQTALAGFGALPATLIQRGDRSNYLVLCAPVLLGSVLFSYGAPSIGQVRADVDAKAGKRTEDVLAAQCTHIAGNYWEVWPAVFHANLASYERGGHSVVWGISYRCIPLLQRMRAMPDDKMRVAIPLDDLEGQIYLERYRFPALVEVERRPAITVWRTKR